MGTVTERQDGTPPRVSHSNPVTAAGFTMIPNAVVLRADLSPQAKLIYGYLKHLAWKNGGGGVDPPREVIARDLHLAERTVVGYVRELQRAPVVEGDESEDAERLLVAVRRGQGRTNVYVLNDPGLPDDAPDSGQSRGADPAPLERHDPPVPARAREEGEEKPKTEELDIPAVTLEDGRNQPLDALAEACGIAGGSPRMIQAAVALNGARGHPEQGIRGLYWGELRRWADDDALTEDDRAGRRATLQDMQEDPAIFSRYLAKAIRRRGQLRQEKMPGVVFGPAKFRDWFLDLDRIGIDADDGFDWGVPE